MKQHRLSNWLRQWDEGNFDFTAAAAGEEHRKPPKPSEKSNQIYETPITKLEQREIRTFERGYPILAVLLCAVIILFLFDTVIHLPAFGSAAAPAHNEVMERYISRGIEETGAVNIVAGVILDYRAFDTLGESHVLYTAACAVLILLLIADRKEEAPEAEIKVMKHDLILRTTAKISVPIITLFGIYVILNGHLGPGGGFSGGAIIGGGLILYAIAYGFDRLEKILNEKTYKIIVLCALCFYSLSKCYSFFCGANGLETVFTTGTPGAILSAGLILPLNIAVGIVVACTMYGFYAVFKRGRI